MNKMSKSEVCSWRLTAKLKAELERAARAEKVSLSVFLERLTRDCLRQRKEQDEAEQERMRAKLLAVAGSFKGPAISATNAEVRRVMGQQLMKKYRASQRRAPRQSS